MSVVQECFLQGLNLVGFAFDGDCRARKVLYDMFRHACRGPDVPAAATTSINHPLFELHAVYPVKGSSMWLLPFSDWLHQGFRFRTQLLDPKKTWDIGGFAVLPQHLPQNKATNISNADLDHSNKQSYSGELTPPPPPSPTLSFSLPPPAVHHTLARY